MATKKLEELKSMSAEDLQVKLENAEADYTKLKLDHAMNGLENPLVIREARRDIARYKTEIRGREVAGMSPEQLAKRSKIRFRRRTK